MVHVGKFDSFLMLMKNVKVDCYVINHLFPDHLYVYC